MVTIPLGINDWESRVEDISRTRLHNMYVAENPQSPDGMSRVSRPTLGLFTEVGTGPIKGMWRQDGTLNGDWFILSGDALYRMTAAGVSTLLGNLSGDGFAQFTGVSDRVIIVFSGVAYSTDGVTITPVVMPDGLPVGSAASINSYILLSVQDSDRFYWITPGGTNPGGLDFATAERSPDPIISISIVSDEIWLLGSSGPEVWIATGDSAAPFQRITARVYNEGCESRDATVNVIFNDLPALMWVTDTRAVVLAQGSPKRVSNESVEELLKEATTLRAWTFRYNRHSFYVLTTDSFSLVYDLLQNRWCRWDTYLLDTWRAHLGGQVKAVAYSGDALSGKIWRLEEGLDDDGVVVIRECSGMVLLDTRYVSCASVIVNVNTGQAPDYTDEPILEMRWSDDQGFTWSEYKQRGLGYRGQYAAEVEFKSLGIVTRPGRIFEFRFTGHSRFRLDYATMNNT